MNNSRNVYYEPAEVTTPLLTLDKAIEAHQPSHVFALFSGGHDSLVNTHITAQHPAFSGVVHLNTGTGIPETLAFVRETCERHGWPLIEKTPQRITFEALCLERGLPGGPKKHEITYHRLKGESIDALVADSKESRHDRILLSTGIRQQESSRRMRLHPTAIRRDGAKVWVNPILAFSARDVNTYIEVYGLQRNPVVDKLHRSGECLCGALARPEELDEIAYWYPDVAAGIRDLERRCFESGLPYNWGSKPSPTTPESQGRFLDLCQSCQTRWEVSAPEIAIQPVPA